MGNVCKGLCKGKPEKTPEEKEKFQEQLNAMLGIKKIDDLIQENNLEKNFLNYMGQNFDMKNPSKYLEDLDKGIFSFDFVQKVFMAAFVWKNILVDHVCKPIVSKRR